MSDATQLALLADNRKIWNNVRDYFPSPYRLQDAETFIASLEDESPILTFAIEFEHQLVGVIGLMPQTDVHRFNAEVGYWIGEPFWGKGIASQALTTITEYAFEELGLQRVFAGVFDGNDASVAVLEKSGYRLELVIENGAYKNGAFLDSYQYAITRANWNAGKSV